VDVTLFIKITSPNVQAVIRRITAANPQDLRDHLTIELLNCRSDDQAMDGDRRNRPKIFLEDVSCKEIRNIGSD
jgi:hypothetical protein